MDELIPALCAAACCCGVYAAFSGGVLWLVHRRMQAVEAQLGRRAQPANETRWLIYAGASVVWASAAVLALVGLIKRDWTRVGRDCTFILFAHFGLALLCALAASTGKAADIPEPVPILFGAAFVLTVSALAALAFSWRWGTERIARIEALPATGEPPGSERWAFYLGSALVGMIGPLTAFLYKEPQNVRMGITALRVSCVVLTLIAIAVGIALPLFAMLMSG